jgi:fibronectin-binding autotransporter adhesin
MAVTHFTGVESATTLAVGTNATVTGTLAVTGASTLTGNASLGGTLTVAGAQTLTTAQFIKGEKFLAIFPNIAAASVGKPFFIAPAACKVLSAVETHVTVCDAADTMTIEKLGTGEAPTNGDVVLAAAFTMNSTANTPVTKAAVTDGKEVMVAGDTLALKFGTGDGTSYDGGCLVVTLVWT